jgi:hypothetical protein
VGQTNSEIGGSDHSRNPRVKPFPKRGVRRIRNIQDEAKPTIDVVSRMAAALNTTVGYLLGENDQADTFKNPEMLKRFKDILSFPKDKREHILYAIDSMIKATKLESL